VALAVLLTLQLMQTIRYNTKLSMLEFLSFIEIRSTSNTKSLQLFLSRCNRHK